MNQTVNYGDSQRILMMNPQTALLDTFIPGFSLLSTALQRYFFIDISLYIPALLAIGIIVFAARYVSEYAWEFIMAHGTCSADIRTDDEIYNMLMRWVSLQNFSVSSRKFVASTNLNSRCWYLHTFEEEDDEDQDESGGYFRGKKDKQIAVTPSFGVHYFFYKKHLMFFKRTQNDRQQYMPISEREEISVSCFGRNPTVLRALLDDCRIQFLKSDENKTLIYRGTVKSGTTEPVWTRCMSRVSRPFSTVVLDENVKQALLDDMSDYLHPATRRWYSNRGIPYRRGYMLYGPPGTGKSSLSFAIAGYFKLKIYIVSLNSMAMNEEALGSLFAELPKQCVVLLEDIDTAGLTHTRDSSPSENKEEDETSKAPTTPGTSPPPTENRGGRISLSALLNIIDGVASQEGRVLIMTTNHIDKLDSALIRPGRVDMQVKFTLANTTMIETIFRGIFATIEGDRPREKKAGLDLTEEKRINKAEAEEKALISRLEAKAKKEEERIAKLAEVFGTRIPSDKFSPAEIQGYLLKFKRNPDGALEGAEAWVTETQKKKEEKARTENLEKEEADKKAKLEAENAAKEKADAEKSSTGKTGEASSEEKPLVNGIAKVNGEKAINGVKEEEIASKT